MDEGAIVLGAITVPGELRSMTYLRRFLRETAPSGHYDPDDVVLVGSELGGNAVAHTRTGKGGKLTVTLSRTNELLLLEVTDDGAGGARPYLKPESGGESGRGMRVVDALALRWGYRPDGDRTTVWAEFPA